MPARLLWSAGAALVALGVAARIFGWDELLWLPRAALDAALADPGSTGLVLLGVLLMGLAGLLRRWRG